MADANQEFLNSQFGGTPTDPNSLFLQSVLGVPAPIIPDVRQAKDIGDAIFAGLQSTALGLAIRGKLPSIQLSEDAPWHHRIAAGGAGIFADIPLMIPGAVAGAAAGTAAAPGAGTIIGAGAGAFAVPMALREALVAAYENNHAASWEGVRDIAFATLKGGAKGAVIGGATAGAGRFVQPLVAPVAGRAVAAGELGAVGARRTVDAATLGTELAALTTTAAALEGKIPTWQDFMDNAILLGGLKGAVHIAKGMRGVYAETGRTPEQILGDAARDPKIAEQLAREPIALPEAYKALALEERIKAAVEADPRPELLREMLTKSPDEPAKLGLDPALDPVKYEYITDKESATGVLREVTRLYQNEITAQTRGVVSNKQTARDALSAISDGVVGEHIVGQAGNAAEIYARAHLLRGAANHAAVELAKIADVNPLDLTPTAKLSALAAIERVAMLKAEIEGVGAEAGRSLQILGAIKRDPSFLGEAETLLKLAERKGALQDVAALAAAFRDSAQMVDFARGYVKATNMEKFLEGWKASILSGPQTQLANISGNLMKWGVELPESTIAAAITAGKRALEGDPLTLAQFKARALAPLYGLQFGAIDAIKIAGEVWKQEGMHLEKADIYRAAIEGKAGEIIRIPFKALQTADALFRTVAERAEAHIVAVDRIIKEGMHPDTLEGRAKIAEYTNRPETGLEQKAGEAAIKRIQEAGAEAVFAQRLGPRMEQLQRAMAGHWMGFIIPFFRTPANLVSWAVQHVPGLNFLSARWHADYAAGGERQARAIARVAVGTALTMTAYSLAEDGMITGGGLFEKEEVKTKQAAGWQPYSIRIGNKYYSYQRIEPVAKVFGLAVDIFDMMKASKDDGDKAKLVSMSVLMFGNATVSTTYLSGLSNAIQSIADPARYGPNFLEQYASSIVPKFVGQTVTAADPYKREVDGVLEAIQSQIPFLREKLMPKRDVWGEPMQNNKWFDVMPVQVSQISEDKVKTEAVRLHLAIADAPKFITERGPFKAKEKRIDLTAEQRDIFREVSGKSAMAILAPIVSGQDWKRIPNFAKAAIYQEVLESTRSKQGQYAALPPDDAERMKIRKKIVGQVLKQVEEAQSR